MSRSSIEIEELLTGLIDGQLSDAERVEIQDRLNADGQLQASLNVLRRNRDLVASLPKASSPAFDARIVALAKERCRESSTSLPHWLGDPQVQRSVAATHPWWKKHAVSLAIAAALTFVLASGIVLSLMQNEDGKNDIAAQSNPPVQPDTQAIPDQPLVSDPPLLAENVSTPEKKNDNTPAPIVPVESANVPGPETIASTVTPQNPPPNVQDPVLPNPIADDPGVTNSLASPNLTADNIGADFALGDFYMVVDVTASKELDPMERFSQLLGRYDIAMAEDLNVGQPVVAILEKSRLLQGQLAEQRQQAGAASTSLLFVKARAVRIDAMIEDMIADVETFPEISLDMVMDTPEVPLLGELRSVQEAELSKSQKDTVAVSVASPLRSGQSGRMFASAQRKREAMSLEQRRSRRANNSDTLKGDASNPISYVLFVVRSPQ